MTQMMKSIRVTFLAGICAAAAAVPAVAQTGAAEQPLFVDINAGVGAKPGALTTATTFTIFGENGSAATQVAPGTSAMLDLRAGYHVTPRVAVAVGLSANQSDVAGTTLASVPSPIRFASPTMVSLEAPSAKRHELGVHLQAVYVRPLTQTVTLAIAGGPSIIRLQQGVANVSLTGATPAAFSANESGNGFGGNVGADLSTLFSTHYGAGVFVRYVAAKVDLPSASGVKVGGVQAGAGLRIRF